eukprot:TRINITY_DN11742_c0_g1_i2.p1 TRINITY_DN11742_c0_g1~~TRINITY_DN11742_c0_g1_i2.p1  ORF type:complete len:123 (+),score=17.83 TRINITY_DN11742_c0_g1_i2:62-430(+)
MFDKARLNISPSSQPSKNQRVSSPAKGNSNKELRNLSAENKALRKLNAELREKLRIIKQENDSLIKENSQLTFSSDTSVISCSSKLEASKHPAEDAKHQRLHDNSTTAVSYTHLTLPTICSV